MIVDLFVEPSAVLSLFLSLQLRTVDRTHVVVVGC